MPITTGRVQLPQPGDTLYQINAPRSVSDSTQTINSSAPTPSDSSVAGIIPAPATALPPATDTSVANPLTVTTTSSSPSPYGIGVIAVLFLGAHYILRKK